MQMRLGKALFALNRSTELLASLPIATQSAEEDPKTIADVGVVGIERKRLLETIDRLVESFAFDVFVTLDQQSLDCVAAPTFRHHRGHSSRRRVGMTGRHSQDQRPRELLNYIL